MTLLATTTHTHASLAETMQALGKAARAATRALAALDAAQTDRALRAAAASLRTHMAEILAANAKDMADASHLSNAMRDRLLLNEKRVEAMAQGMETVANLPNPLGRVLEGWDVATNGLHIEKVAIPLGVIGMIYESRPNVTADATALAVKSGNAIILRGGSDSFYSSRAILAAIHEGFAQEGLPETAAQMVPVTDREAVQHLLTMHDYIDVIIPRGGKSLTERVRNDARVPTLLHLDANVHLYIDAAADAVKAQHVILNAKLRRTGVCGAVETLLIDKKANPEIAKNAIAALLEGGCEIRGDAAIQALDTRVIPATEEDWATEYLAPILAVKMVDGVEDAITHINHFSSHHTDAIVTEDATTATRFTQAVDSAIVLVNASTQFADGGEFGFGAEIGIATGRLHARGPVGAAQLTTYKYIVTTARSEGAVRAG